MNLDNTTLREVNNTIAYFKRKKLACQEAIDELEAYKKELLKEQGVEL